ncbi:MAG: peptidoglycan DD-metalloendopeptidase family protein [bacterium]|nr:peptidoglycan DD-metalloendopeptidase family protein [bacterium]
MNISSKPSIFYSRIKAEISSIHISLLFLLVLVLVVNGFLVSFAAGSGSSGVVLGGPDENSIGDDSQGDQKVILDAAAPLRDVFGGEERGSIAIEEDIPTLYLVKSASFSNNGAVLDGSLTNHESGILSYKVQEGDSLSKIAEQFGISLNTLLWANSGAKNNQIHRGDELTILPVSGVLYEVKSGDTVESLAASFGVLAEEIIKINNIENSQIITPAEKLIIPNGKPLRSLASIASESTNNLPSIPGYFISPLPKNSWNWGILHKNNAVDIANVCGTPISAAASGIVTKVGDPSSWNGGYGGYLVIEHQNGTETLYSHTSLNLVDVGKMVEQGEKIAEVGNTGNVKGITGCHVHFEVRGARNPFVK